MGIILKPKENIQSGQSLVQISIQQGNVRTDLFLNEFWNVEIATSYQ